MRNRQQYLPGMNHILCGRPPKSPLALMEAKIRNYRESSLSELISIFGKLIPSFYLQRKEGKVNSRSRNYSLSVTFWAFLWQVLTPETACREVVRKVQSFCSELKIKLPSSSNVAYCKARARIGIDDLNNIHKSVSSKLLSKVDHDQLWLGHRVKVVDGTGIRLADTPENQELWPQPSEQKPGCGFPVMQIVGCFCLSTGVIIDWVETSIKRHECRIFRKMMHLFNPSDIVVGDRGFSSYGNIAVLLNKGVQAVMRAHQMRKLDYREGKPLGKLDRLVTWRRPASPNAAWSREDWNALPKQLSLRIVRIKVEIKGFRVQQYDLVTTLTDSVKYPREELEKLYFKRWSVELYFRQIKTTMGMEKLRCKTPQMVRKELRMYLIAYNLIRGLIQEAASAEMTELDRISFKGAVDTVRQFSNAINATKAKPRIQAQVISEMLKVIAEEIVPDREGRSEPRALKERQKPYPRITSHRSTYVVPKSRKGKGNKGKYSVANMA